MIANCLMQPLPRYTRWCSHQPEEAITSTDCGFWCSRLVISTTPLPPPPQHHQYLVVLELMHNCVIVIDANETVKLMTVLVIQYESTKIAI